MAMEHTIKYSLLYNILCLHMNLVLCRSRESLQSPGGAKRRKSRAELVRQLSKQKSIISQMVDEDMPEQTTTLIQEEKAEEGVVGFTINSFFFSLSLRLPCLFFPVTMLQYLKSSNGSTILE